jgi:hypothetical protein
VRPLTTVRRHEPSKHLQLPRSYKRQKGRRPPFVRGTAACLARPRALRPLAPASVGRG